MLERSEAYSLLFAKNLNQQVFLQFVLPTVVRYGRIALSEEVQFARLDAIVRNLTSGMLIDSVTIYDSEENIVSYSTIPEMVGKTNLGGLEYKKALQGLDNSTLDSSGSLFSILPGSSGVTSKLKTYIAFRQGRQSDESNRGNIMGVIEVSKDLSGDMQAIVALQARIIVLSFSVMGVLFAVLSIIVVRANRVIEERIKERQQLETKLHEAERLASLGKMVAAVSHEIKNPLGIVRSTAEILGKRIHEVAPGNEHLASIIVDETSRLDSIVRQFLGFARPKEPDLKSVHINTLIERLSRFMEPELEKHGVRVQLQLWQNLAPIMIDEEQVYQALMNLVFNAIHAMQENGLITISSKPAGKGQEILVRDNGVGMSEEKMQQIFTPFFTDKNKGSGLGLAISKNIIEKHGGSIAVASEEGHGATFTIFLPGGRVPTVII